MSNFKDWALRYVLAEDESVLRQVSESAAREIESAHANSTVVGNWASSIQPWISGARDDGPAGEGEEVGSGDVIARAKALGFLAATLEGLDRGSLKADQVQRLCAFFGSMFSYDHKAGITAATKALRELYRMKSFRPAAGVQVLDSVTRIKDDFRLQTVATRLQVYTLLRDVLQNPAIRSELDQKYGAGSDFATNLLQLSQNERDPENLVVWFQILKTLLTDYSPPPKIVEDCFKAFSAYFPITLRSSATSAGITVDDLKGSLRECFSASQHLAALAFPYLLQKLDQGDAVTVAVKVDILRTINACVGKYDQPEESVVPYIRKIWDSLKYEVRNGEVKDTITATLDVLRGISDRLAGMVATSTGQYLHDYVDTVFQDCRDDLSNPTYTKQSGLLMNTVAAANLSAFARGGQVFISLVETNLRQPKSPNHRKDLLGLLNLYLRSRSDEIKSTDKNRPSERVGMGEDRLRALFYEVYLPTWRDLCTNSDTESVGILKEVVHGMALLVSQKASLVHPDPPTEHLLLPGTTCDEICSLLSLRVVELLSLSANDRVNTVLQDEVVLALRTIVRHYTEGYGILVESAVAEIKRRSWSSPSPYHLETFRNLVTKLAFVGCSEVPLNIPTDKTPTRPYSALQHFIKLMGSLLCLLPPGSDLLGDRRVYSIVIAAMHCAMLNFRDACFAKFDSKTLGSFAGQDKNWLEDFRDPAYMPSDLQADDFQFDADDPQLYLGFLKLCLWAVYTLYRQAVGAGGSGIYDDLVLTQIANMAAFTVRNLDERLQRSCDLANEAFAFFSDPTKTESTLYSEYLTMGILEGLWPSAMMHLYAPDGVAQKYMCDMVALEKAPRKVTQLRAGIGAILSNKYRGPGAVDPNANTLKSILEFWTGQLSQSASDGSIQSGTFDVYSTISMYTLAGALARMDRNAIGHVPRLHEALASSLPNGDLVAQSIDVLVKDIPFLSSENHAVVKPLYRQWVYNYVARPLYEKALPPAKGQEASRYAAAILAIVNHCPYNAYEPDLPQLVRLLISTISKESLTARRDIPASTPETESVVPPPASSISQAPMALHILLQILAADATTLTEHLHALIIGAVELHAAASQRKSGMTARDLHAIPTRRFALQLLGALPGKYEERYLLAHSPRMQQVLANATGDSVREVRKVAREARESWAKVV